MGRIAGVLVGGEVPGDQVEPQLGVVAHPDLLVEREGLAGVLVRAPAAVQAVGVHVIGGRTGSAPHPSLSTSRVVVSSSFSGATPTRDAGSVRPWQGRRESGPEDEEFRERSGAEYEKTGRAQARSSEGSCPVCDGDLDDRTALDPGSE